MKKFGILMTAGLMLLPVVAIAADEAATSTTETTIVIDPTATKAMTTEVEGPDGKKTVITTTPSVGATGTPTPAPAQSQTTVVVDPKNDGPRDAITGEVVKPVEATPEELSLRDKVRHKMEQDKADEDKKLEDSKE